MSKPKEDTREHRPHRPPRPPLSPPYTPQQWRELMAQTKIAKPEAVVDSLPVPEVRARLATAEEIAGCPARLDISRAEKAGYTTKTTYARGPWLASGEMVDSIVVKGWHAASGRRFATARVHRLGKWQTPEVFIHRFGQRSSKDLIRYLSSTPQEG